MLILSWTEYKEYFSFVTLNFSSEKKKPKIYRGTGKSVVFHLDSEMSPNQNADIVPVTIDVHPPEDEQQQNGASKENVNHGKKEVSSFLEKM